MAEKARATESDAPPKGGKRKLVVGAVAILILGGGAGAAAYFLGLLPGGADAAAADVADAHGEPAAGGHGQEADGHGAAGAGGGEHAGRPPVVAFVDLPDLIVNLQSDSKRPRFLKLRVALEVDSEVVGEGVKTLAPRVMDSFQMYLRALSVDEVQGSAGMQKLKEEMMARVNLAIEPHRIRDVLFKEMLVQ